MGVVELIVTPGIINVDFADVRAVVQDSGSAIVGVGISRGEDRAVNAVKQALNSPLLEVSPEGAHGVVLGISGGKDIRMNEINEAAKIVAQSVDPGARIIFGAYYDRRLKQNQIKITIIATGFNGQAASSSLFGRFGVGKTGLFEPKDNPVAPETRPTTPSSFVEEPREAPKDDKPKQKKEDEDVWEIPTFLRKKKR
jgi:cell division protein FtsZ